MRNRISSVYLHKKGYDVVGSDLSSALIDIARNKSKRLDENIKFINADMRDVSTGEFDAVISIFNSIGHLPKEDFKKALDNIYNNLDKTVLYIFDIFNLEAMNADVVKDFKMNIETVVNGDKIVNKQDSKLDGTLLVSHDCYVIEKADGTRKVYKNTFSLQIYTSSELAELLDSAGFEIIEQYDFSADCNDVYFGNRFEKDKSLSMLNVCRKKA